MFKNTVPLGVKGHIKCVDFLFARVTYRETNCFVQLISSFTPFSLKFIEILLNYIEFHTIQVKAAQPLSKLPLEFPDIYVRKYLRNVYLNI